MGDEGTSKAVDPRDTCPNCSKTLDHDAKMMYRARHEADAIYESAQKVLTGVTPRTRTVKMSVSTLREMKSKAADASLALAHGVEVNGGAACTED